MKVLKVKVVMTILKRMDGYMFGQEGTIGFIEKRVRLVLFPFLEIPMMILLSEH